MKSYVEIFQGSRRFTDFHVRDYMFREFEVDASGVAAHGVEIYWAVFYKRCLLRADVFNNLEDAMRFAAGLEG